jgi:uncharacterized protein (DUF305 family)
MRKELACSGGGGPACCLQRPSPTSTTTGAQAAFNDADVRFLQAMIPHRQQAIDAAKLVGSRTDTPSWSSSPTPSAPVKPRSRP